MPGLFSPTQSMATMLYDLVSDKPLEDGEIRRIVGMGGHYITRSCTDLSGHNLNVFCSLTIDGDSYLLCVPE